MNVRARRLAVLLTGALFAPAIVLASLPAADVNPAAAAAPTGAWISSTPTGFKRQEVTYVTVDISTAIEHIRSGNLRVLVLRNCHLFLQFPG